MDRGVYVGAPTDVTWDFGSYQASAAGGGGGDSIIVFDEMPTDRLNSNVT